MIDITATEARSNLYRYFDKAAVCYVATPIFDVS
jgi:hypothetical protein